MINTLKNFKRIVLTLFVCFVTIPIYSQVTIGSLKDPEPFSLLELISENDKYLEKTKI